MITMWAVLAITFAGQSVEEARGREISWAEAAALPTTVKGDFDGDGAQDFARMGLVPHSYRHDIDIVLAKAGNRPIHLIAAHQPDKGALIHRGIRLLPPGSYATACARKDGYDVQPCLPGTARVTVPGVELYAPGGTRHLIWWDGAAFMSARAADPDVEQEDGKEGAE